MFWLPFVAAAVGWQFAPADTTVTKKDRLSSRSVKRFVRGDFVAVLQFISREEIEREASFAREGKTRKIPLFRDTFRVISCNDPATPRQVHSLSSDPWRKRRDIVLPAPTPGGYYLVSGNRAVNGYLRGIDSDRYLPWGTLGDVMAAGSDEIGAEWFTPTNARSLQVTSSSAFTYFKTRLDSLGMSGAAGKEDALFFRLALQSGLTDKDFDGEAPEDWIRRNVGPQMIARALANADLDGRLILGCLASQLNHPGAQKSLFVTLKEAIGQGGKLSFGAESYLRATSFSYLVAKPEEWYAMAIRTSDSTARRLLVSRVGSPPTSIEGAQSIRLLLDDPDLENVRTLLYNLAHFSRRIDLMPSISKPNEIRPELTALISFWKSKSPEEILRLLQPGLAKTSTEP